MLDLDGTVKSWNAGAQRLKGYSPEEIIGANFRVFYTDEDVRAGEPLRSLETALASGRFEAEGWRVRKDGTRLWASVVIDAVREPGGEIVGFAKVTRDLTQGHTERLARDEVSEQQRLTGIRDRSMAVTLGDENRLLVMAEELAHVGHWRLDLKSNEISWSAETASRLSPLSKTPSASAQLSVMQPELAPEVTTGGRVD